MKSSCTIKILNNHTVTPPHNTQALWQSLVNLCSYKTLFLLILSLAFSLPASSVSAAPTADPDITSSVTTLIATEAVAITPITIINSGGAVPATGAYSISPLIANGLSFNTDTGEISGTPASPASAQTYIITAANDGGTDIASVIITVNAAPIIVANPSTLIANVGTAITPTTIMSTGGPVTSYFITLFGDQSLNAATGLDFDTSTGSISGTPTMTTTGALTYGIFATNAPSLAGTSVVITILAAPAPDISPSVTALIATQAVAITPITIDAAAGGAVDSYSISPLIANGLSFNTDTGEISGTPTAVAGAQTYTITATNAAGDNSASVTITVNAAPIIAADPHTLIATVGTAITPTSITNTGGPVTSYAISLANGQSLEANTGLVFDTSTGSISGTPTMAADRLFYTISATNAPGHGSASIDITIVAAPDISPSVPTLTATVGTAIPPITITNNGGAVPATGAYSISPNLPAGLSINTDTGEISGTPTEVAGEETYTITANGVGIPTVTATATVDITVNAADNTAPDAPVITQPTTPTNNDSITISGSAEADATVTLTQNGTALATTATVSSTGTWSIEVSLSADNNGANTFTATAADQAGNVSDVSNEVTVTLDQTKPTIAIRNTSLTSPTNDNPILINLLFSEPLIGFEASDITVHGGTITAGSYQVVSTVADGRTVNVTFTITPSADGLVQAGVAADVATDAAGNGNANAGFIVITYDGTAPDVAITSTAQTVNTAAFTLTGTTEASATVDVLKAAASIGAAIVSGGTWTFDVMLTEGANLFTVTASDAAGNVSEVSAAVSITRDSTPAPSDTTRPSVAISSFPVTANIVNGDTVNATTLRYEALFDESVSGFEIGDITVTGTAGVTMASGLTGAGRFRQFEVGRGNLDGTVIVSIAADAAQDAAGNSNTASGDYTLTIDTTPPVITRNGDAALTIVSGTTYTDAGATASDNIAGTITGSITTSFTLDGAEVASLNSSQLGTYVITYDVSDAASNPAPAVTRTVTVVEALSASSVIATAAGDKIRLQFVDQQLTNNDAAPGDFTLSGAGAAETTVTGLAVDAADGTVLILSLSGNIAKDAAVTLAYTRMAGSISGVSTSTSRNGIVTNFTATAVNTSNIVAEAAVAVPSISISSATVTATVGNAIADISITSNGGTVASYGIAPTLPEGLTLDTSNGTISGTPTAVSTSTSYTITATNSSGLDTVTLTIVVNAAVLAPDIPPSATPFGVNLTVGVPISPITIVNSGGAATYSFSPDLPAGLSIDSTTGTISGTPTAATIAGAISYTITATNSAGSDSIQGLLTVQQEVAAPDISVSPDMLTFTVGIAVTTNPITITNNGGHVNSYTIEDANGQTLSENTGLSHSADGVIFGTPTMSASTEIYTITATNRNGVSDSATITITVNEAVPSISISSATVTATVGNAIADISITSNGGTVASYGIAPTLPEGLTLDTSNGTISGTPTAVSTSTSYTITATNSGGSDTATVAITVEAAADTTPPAAPLISTTAQTVNTVAFTLSGTADAAASIQLLRAGNAITSATTDADTNGDWSITFDLTEGENLITATASDSADNTSAASAAVSITLDTVAPTVTFTNPTQLVRTAAFTLTGTTEAGATVDVRKGGTPIGAANVTVTTWSLATTLIEGFNAFTVIATDAAGNTSTATITITLNTLLAEAPVITVINTVLNNANEQGVICITFDGDVKFDGSPNAAFLNARPGDFVVSSDTSPAPTVIGFVGACFVDSVTHNNTIQLTLNRQIAFGETATLSYTKTGTEHNTKGIRRDVTGSSEPLADFSNEPITNNAIEPIEGLELVSAGTLSANQIFLSFGLEVVTASPDLVAADFTVSGAASSPMVTGISQVAPSALLLTLSANIVGGETITLSYTKTTGSISGASAGELVSFDDYSVTNTRPAPAPVTAPSISISQATVTATVGTAIAPITIASTGGAVASYSIEPALPAGLTLDATTGTISGTPTAAASEISYTITATNASDTDTATVAITVEAAADTTPPSVTISSLPVSIVNGDTVNATTLRYEAIFDEAVSGFEIDDITVSGTAGVTTASGLTGAGQFYQFEVLKGNLDGTVIVSIAENIAEDAAGNGNTASGDYTLTIDATPPVITLTGDAALTLVIGTDYTDAGATANDNTGGDITSSITTSFTLDGIAVASLNSSLPGTYIITYNVSDAASNPAPAVTRTVTMVEALSPNTNGVIATAAGDKIRLQFVDQQLTNNGAAPGNFSLSGAAGITVTELAVDADDSTVLILTLSGNIAKDAAVTLAYTRMAGSISGVSTSTSSNGIVTNFTATDVDTGSIVAVPNISISSATVTATVGNAIADISITSNGGTVASYGIAPTLPDGLTLDTSNGTISGTPTAVSASTSYTITATNSAGEAMVTLTITVEAAADTTAPDAPVIIQPTTPTTDDSITISGTAEADATVTLTQNGNALTSSTATADANGNWSIEVTLSADNNGANTFTATASDQAGNISGVSNSVTVTLDNTAPIITLTGANPQIIESGADYTELGATTDDGSVVSIDSSAYRNVVGTYIITYTATDGTNQATATRTVNVVDTTAPTITLTRANPQTIELGAGYTELGASADDGSEVTIDSSAYRNVVGTYIITYTATDGTNQATATRTVNVVDTTAPIITLTGANPQTIELGAGYTELGASADDGSTVTIDDDAFMDIVGTYTITYTATDGTNPATPVTRTVNVVDTTAPIITLTGDDPQTIELGAGYTELGATADDGSTVTIDDDAFMDVVGTYTITYTATDGTNPATPVTRTVNVVDTTAPTVAISTTAQTVNTAAFTLAGTVEAGGTVDVLKDGTSIGAASVTGTRWSLAVTLDDGANTFTATATDATDNTSDPTDAVIITLDTAPSFGSAAITAIANKSYTYTAGTAIPVLTLPKATGGNGALTYSLSPILPQGLIFDTTRRTISGTPEAETASTSYTYIAADSDTNTAATDTASLTFSITVLSDGLSEEDIQRLNLAIMPRLTQALVASSAASVERRVDSAFASAETTASYQLDGYQIQFDSETTTTEKLTADLLQKLAGYTRSHKDGNINWKQLLTNSSFLIPLNSADQTGADQASAANTGLALWGSGDYTRLSENDSDLDWQGDLTSYQLGLDKRLDNLLLGGMLSWSEGDVDYTLEGDEGSYNHKMTSIHPYLAWNNDHTNLWGSLGYGQGDLTIEQEDNSHSTDTNLLSLAAGIKGQLISGLSLKSDLLLARTDINAAADMNIAKQTIDSQRFRLLLEIAGQYTLASGGSIKPMLEIGARYDGGDGNSGTGAVLGAGMRYANLTGLTLEGNLHALVGQGNYKEWGIQALISLDPGTDKLGLAFSLRPGYGYNGSSSDTSALWQQSLPQSNLYNSAVDYSAPDYDARLGARLSYGLLAPSLVGLLTPYSEITLGTINSYRLGIRWQGTARFDLHLFGERRESSGNLEGSRGADQAIQLEGRIHF